MIGHSMNKCLTHGCRNLQTTCIDCGRVVSTATFIKENEWISVKDRLPKDKQECFVYGKLEHQEVFDIHKAIFHFNIEVDDEINKNRYYESQFWEYEWAYDFEIVTHWMPLPLPPKE